MVRNFSEFLARGALGWENFDDSMKEAVHSEEGLKSEQRWAPRAWVACVVCALQDWGETRVPVRIGGTPCRDDCPEGCSAHCFFRNPKAVAELLDPERYVDDEHWSWLPKEEVRRSCPTVVLCIDGVRQRRRLLLHRRRLQDDEACTGQRAVPVCRLCYTALAATKPRMPLHALANGLWLGRHPEILRQMPYAHRLLLPTTRVMSQRAVFGATSGADWEKAFKQKGMEGIVLFVSQASREKQVSAFPPKDLGDTFQAIFVGVNPDDTTRGLVATVTKQLFEGQARLLRKHNVVVQASHYDEDLVPETPRESQRVPESPRESQRVPETLRNPQRIPESPGESQRLPESPRESQRVPESPIESQRVQDNSRESQRVPESVRDSQRVPGSP